MAAPTEVRQNQSAVIEIFVVEGVTPLNFHKNLQLFWSNERGPGG